MRVENARLLHNDGSPYPFAKSPNMSGKAAPEYLIIHFTEGQTVAGAIAAMTDPQHKGAAHLLIGRDGTITQLVPFDRAAWHTGPSAWEERKGLAPYSIGIELDNAGPMTRKGGQWISAFGRPYPDNEVIEATHKYGQRPFGWHTFTEPQLSATVDAAAALFQAYPLKAILGHDDISPGRKWDPGPAFPMVEFRLSVMAKLREAADAERPGRER